MNIKQSIGTLALVAIAVVPALAQTTPATSSASAGQAGRLEQRWTAYLGCWRLAQESVGIDATATLNRGLPGLVVCVKPSSSAGGVTMTTFADGKAILEQTVVADGIAHPVTEAGCQGTQTSTWSHDAQRLFTAVEVACSGQPRQNVSGITLFAKGPAWVDIQAIAADGDQHVRIRRYERTATRPDGVAELPASITVQAATEALAASVTSLDLEDVTEAITKVAPAAVEAALVETGSRFNLNSRALRRLAAAKVPPRVIDLMVAQSFPEHFSIERPTLLPPQPMPGSMAGTAIIGGAQYPYPFYSYGMYDPFAYYSYYYYSPFAYPYYWGNNYYRGSTYYITNGSNTVFVPAGSSGSSGGTAVSTGEEHGQMIHGRGYTRVTSGQPADATPSPSGQGNTSGAHTVRSSGTADSSSSSSPSSSSGGGSVSSGGYSGGGAETGRTAQPR